MQTICMDKNVWVKEKPKKLIKLIKNYDEDSNKEDILEVDVEYPKDFHELHSA